MDTKVCSRCNSEKDVTEYFKGVRFKDGLQPACKTCMNDSSTRSRKKKQQHYQQVAKDRHKRNTEQIRTWKSEQGCKVCGETYAQCLELHHTDPTEKEFDPAEGAAKSWNAFLLEAEKCVVLCANCHRKVHGGVIELKLGVA